MPLSVKTEGGVTTVTLSGEADHHGARAMMAALEDTVADLLPMHLTLDLSGLTFMDSSGIAVVVQTARKCHGCGGKLAVTGTPPQAQKVLTCAGIHRLVDIR